MKETKETLTVTINAPVQDVETFIRYYFSKRGYAVERLDYDTTKRRLRLNLCYITHSWKEQQDFIKHGVEPFRLAWGGANLIKKRMATKLEVWVKIPALSSDENINLITGLVDAIGEKWNTQ